MSDSLRTYDDEHHRNVLPSRKGTTMHAVIAALTAAILSFTPAIGLTTSAAPAEGQQPAPASIFCPIPFLCIPVHKR